MFLQSCAFFVSLCSARLSGVTTVADTDLMGRLYAVTFGTNDAVITSRAPSLAPSSTVRVTRSPEGLLSRGVCRYNNSDDGGSKRNPPCEPLTTCGFFVPSLYFQSPLMTFGPSTITGGDDGVVAPLPFSLAGGGVRVGVRVPDPRMESFRGLWGGF